MSQRNSEYERKERDLYETPEWATLALKPHIPSRVHDIWEPACGSGKMARALRSIKWGVYRSDIEPQKGCDFPADFLKYRKPIHVDAIITNPPYNLATEFIEHALDRMKPNKGMVAMLLRCDFDHAKGRRHLFGDCPAFAKKVVLTKRIVWFAGENGKPKASPSFNHAWFLWDWKHKGPPTLEYHYEDATAQKTLELEIA